MKLLQPLGYICVLVASMVLGNWFLAELRRARAARKPWYAPYITAPGILILVIVLVLPVFIYFF